MQNERPSLPFFDRLLVRMTTISTTHPLRVVFAASLVAFCSWFYASGLRIEGSFVALLPSESPTAKRFQETLSRKAGGNSTLIVMVRSDEVDQNRAFVDRLSEKLVTFPKSQVFAVEKGPGASREFFRQHKWLFAPEPQLALLKCRIEREHDKRMPGYLDLEDPCDESVDVPLDPNDVTLPSSAAAEGDDDSSVEPTPRAGAEASAGAATPPAAENSSEKTKARTKTDSLRQFDEQLEEQLRSIDRYPTGYFQNDEGTLFSIMVRAPSAGMGEFSSDELFTRVKAEASALRKDFPHLELGYAGDIPNAIEQRNALISDMATISLIAVGLILGSIIIYFRSVVALLQIGFCVTVGCGMAFAVAMGAYGRLNTATSFLGAIIAGNGINYGIVYLARYRELRSQGQDGKQALIEAALSSRKGTWLAALAAGGAYAALLLTSFRGFSEFGLIGGVGMLFCWLATFASLPAQVTLAERWFPESAGRVRPTLPLPLGKIGGFASRHSGLVLLVAGLLTFAAVVPLPHYLKDPWEYDFSRLGSQSSKKKGAGQWSRGANKVFQSRGSPMLMMGDEMEQVLGLRAQLRSSDQAITGGKYIERVETIYDRLGGGPEVVERKLALLSEIRTLIDKVAPRLSEKDREIADKWRPPETLHRLTPDDLPELVRSQFEERDGTIGTPLYVYLNRGLSQSRGENLLRIAEIFETVHLPDGTIAPNASRSTVFAAMIRAMEHDGPLATLVAFLTVIAVTVVVTRRFFSACSILGSLLCGILLTVGGAAWLDVRLNFLNFVALPLTFGIGVEYAINLYERIRMSERVEDGVASVGGPVALCSLTTIVGYGALILADNMALQSFGRYAIAGELACILTALLVLPAALCRSRQYQGGRNKAFERPSTAAVSS